MMAFTAGAALPLLLVAAALVAIPARVAASRRLHAIGRTHHAPAEVSRRANQEADPLAVASVLDLLAACLRAGLPMAGAARAVAPEAPEPLGEALRRAADLLALGADAAMAWQQVARDADGRPGAQEIESLARMARRSARSGSSLAAAVTELAEQRRAAVEDIAAAKAERAGVLIGGPLGLCFLPAFVCLGIVPVVIGLAGQVLEGGGL
ncbi:type II secretion system F family protein [Nocardia beijingensis]|uniref:type II secretion system F family protein n=1 Tax=Nocardia beijingensis TaxID=95162 RepID=UPI0034093F38